ncbi:MAG: NUDIX hydrolase [Chloroflexota bacterium]
MTHDLQPETPGWTVHRVGQGILLGDNGVLLSGNRWFSGKPLVWTLPGGRAEEGEGISDALVREFREETGLDIEVGALAYVAESRSVVRKQIFLVCAFVVTRVAGDLSCEGDEAVEELRFVHVSEIGSYMPAPSIGGPLRSYFEQGGAGARYWFFPEYTSS